MNAQETKIFGTVKPESAMSQADIKKAMAAKQVYNSSLAIRTQPGDTFVFPDTVEAQIYDIRSLNDNSYYVVATVKNGSELFWMPVSWLTKVDFNGKPIGEVAVDLLETQKVSNQANVVEAMIKNGHTAVQAGDFVKVDMADFKDGKRLETPKKSTIAPLNYVKE
jgi:hypothetical protein